ncbi:MAG: flavodoxin domain-containing protein [Thermodesulfobacteriota bacterium]
MFKSLIVYDTKRGETQKIAEMLAEELRSLDIEVKLSDVHEIKDLTDLFGYNAYLFGCPTYLGEMTENMKEMLFLAARADLVEKVGGAFGAYGWSGEVPKRIHGTMQHVFKMNMTAEPLMLSSSTVKIAGKMIKKYCQEIAAKLNNRTA